MERANYRRSVENRLNRTAKASRAYSDPATHQSPCQFETARIFLSPAKNHRVKSFIEANLERDIRLDDLARIADLSTFHFARVFKLTEGTSPYQYLAGRRLWHARQRLSESDMPIAELALACGFASQSHFTAAFSRAFGEPPGRFRRRAQG